MTRPTATKHYPQAFLDIAELLSKDPKAQVKMTFQSEKEAKSFRLDLYTFKQAAIKEGLTDVWREIAAITTELHGVELIVMHKDFTPSAILLTAAVERAKAESERKQS